MKTSLVVLSLALTFAAPAVAHHPGADLDEMMGSEEKFFQVIDEPAAPPFELADAGGKMVRLSDFSDKIVVLNFIFASCTDFCPLHSELIAEVQKKVNDTPMKDMVQFLTVTTDPARDTREVLEGYGPLHRLDARNWMFLTTNPGQPEDTTRKLSEEYNVRFEPLDGGQQMHGMVTHIIDRGGRFAAKFHGMRFDPLNMVLYINGLTNNIRKPAESEPGWWDNLKAMFR
ncbi:SCO family protein [Mesorhizobium sp. M9A.F.Ca.ET.002.03.1.2]|uniref:SCO family protein n=1 Tax=Mesorhizobium sp. M9A.F.Ca.ET.002.03.1.2 TaxID=2493668 RepID=UPI000F75D08F|nr:SCO family protein [Mesorhizobium sp. M9A.F.Ca.ET.002.03.1.2]AZO00973.1 SCO family protein [Mesorhizobium sp. M9A.F.Ca.ET.002.03.1.2]